MSRFSFTFLFVLAAATSVPAQVDERAQIAVDMRRSLKAELLDPWYPRSVDREYGGFLSSFTYDFKPASEQDKMIVTQARHVWTNAKASLLFPDISHYRTSAERGFRFLHDVMWDKTYGGFYTLVDQKGNPKESNFAEKEAYGNSFGLYALSAYYQAFGDTSALNLAKKLFYWLENHSHDPVQKGYFQHMHRDGTPEVRRSDEPSTSARAYKDQNTSIHMLEALTELYTVWPDPLVKERLAEMLALIRDTITTPKGYLTLFLTTDWKPITYRDSSEEVIMKHRYIDHVSFGHDIETAYLLIEASHVMGISHDEKTLKAAKRMVDHTLQNGWDNIGGIYDEGYYFNNAEGISIIRDTKNWWAQAETLNTLLLMADLYPNDPMNYLEKFKMQWAYINEYLIDHEYGDWYAGGLDKEPQHRSSLKGHIWKAAYHQFRSLTNCLQRLDPDRRAPGTPAGLKKTGSSVEWQGATDDRGVIGYNIYLNDQRIAYTPLTVIQLPEGKKSGSFTVRAVDLAGNESPNSIAVTF